MKGPMFQQARELAGEIVDAVEKHGTEAQVGILTMGIGALHLTPFDQVVFAYQVGLLTIDMARARRVML